MPAYNPKNPTLQRGAFKVSSNVSGASYGGAGPKITDPAKSGLVNRMMPRQNEGPQEKSARFPGRDVPVAAEARVGDMQNGLMMVGTIVVIAFIFSRFQ